MVLDIFLKACLVAKSRSPDHRHYSIGDKRGGRREREKKQKNSKLPIIKCYQVIEGTKVNETVNQWQRAKKENLNDKVKKSAKSNSNFVDELSSSKAHHEHNGVALAMATRAGRHNMISCPFFLSLNP